MRVRGNSDSIKKLIINLCQQKKIIINFLTGAKISSCIFDPS